MLAKDKQFVMQHDEPMPFTYQSKEGKDIVFEVPGGVAAHAYEVKAAKPTNVTVLVFQEWWGLNDYVKKESEKIAGDLNVNVLALDLYDKKVATTREDASKLVQSVKSERIIAIINGAYNHLGSNTKVFTWGWCFGGGWSLQAALLGGNKVAGCIMYYGAPEKDVNKLKTLNCDVIAFFAEKDKGLSPEVADAFKKDMEKADKKLMLYEYDADHAFANPSNPVYNKQAASDAYAKATAFVKERM